MSKSVRDTLRGKLIYKLMYAATAAGAAAARLCSREERERAAVEMGYICHLLDTYMKHLEQRVPLHILETLQEVTSENLEANHVDLAPKP